MLTGQRKGNDVSNSTTGGFVCAADAAKYRSWWTDSLVSGAPLELARIQAASGAGIHHIKRGGGRLILEGVELDLPDGRPLIANVNFSLGRGDSALLCGPSGAGKSTLLSARAGILPFGSGEIQFTHPTAELSFCLRSLTCRSGRCGR